VRKRRRNTDENGELVRPVPDWGDLVPLVGERVDAGRDLPVKGCDDPGWMTVATVAAASLGLNAKSPRAISGVGVRMIRRKAAKDEPVIRPRPEIILSPVKSLSDGVLPTEAVQGVVVRLSPDYVGMLDPFSSLSPRIRRRWNRALRRRADDGGSPSKA